MTMPSIPSITEFSEDSDLPLRIGLLVDRSDSVRKEFSAEQQAARSFLQSVLRPGIDSIFLLDFTHELKFSRPLITDPQMLTREVGSLRSGGQTALYDALYAAVHTDEMTSEESMPVRRAIILLSDGNDNYSLHGLDEVALAAQQIDVSVYALTVHSPRVFNAGDGVLGTLADQTGGRAFVLPNLKPLNSVFSEIQDELRRRYSMAYRPDASQACGYHTLSVRAHDKNLKVHARRGYYLCQPDRVLN